jgi:hypothetical protein
MAQFYKKELLINNYQLLDRLNYLRRKERSLGVALKARKKGELYTRACR